MTAPIANGLGNVYLMWAVDTQRFKIGFSKDPGKRAKSLELGSPFKIAVVASMPGTIADEQSLHIAYKEFRVHREWFELPEPAVWRVLCDFGISVQEVHARVWQA